MPYWPSSLGASGVLLPSVSSHEKNISEKFRYSNFRQKMCLNLFQNRNLYFKKNEKNFQV